MSRSQWHDIDKFSPLFDTGVVLDLVISTYFISSSIISDVGKGFIYVYFVQFS